MIKVKNSELNETATISFNELLEIDLPVSLSWKIAKLAKEIDELIILKKESTNKLVKKHALKDEDGEMVVAKNEEGEDIPGSTRIADPDKYNKEYEKFDSLENEINFDPISISLIESKNDNIKPKILFNLSFLFTD